MHDRGELDADFDALAAVASPSLTNANDSVPVCRHTDTDCLAVPEVHLVTINRWEELLEDAKRCGCRVGLRELASLTCYCCYECQDSLQ